MTDARYTQNDLEEALRRFPGAAETDEAMLAEVIRRAGVKGSRSYRGQIAAAAAVLAGAVVLPHMGADGKLPGAESGDDETGAGAAHEI